jgi:DNA-binding response OmpR family regulator
MTMKKRVLLVEDDEALADIVCHNLRQEGFDVHRVANGDVALDAAMAFAPDVALVDVMIPGRNGFDLCGSWREQGRFPVILVTVRDRREDKIRGFKMGADDYITKPFHLEELLARVHAVLRRGRREINRLRLGSVDIDFAKHMATAPPGNRSLGLTRREFDILRYLAERAPTVVYRAELLKYVWRLREDAVTRSVDRAIARLRTKIERNPRRPAFIHTAHGDGYFLTPEGEDRTEPE